MQTVLIVIHLMIVLALVGVVLIQRSEGGGLGVGGGSGFMSARGTANALTRTTAILATLFFITSLGLGLLARYEAKPTDILDRIHHISFAVEMLLTLMMVIGFLVAWLFYIRRPDLPVELAQSQDALYQFLLNKWYFDEAYNFLFIKPALWVGRVLWKQGDGTIIDGFGPNGVSARVLDVTGRVVRLQSGYLYHYAFVMLIGVAAFITWFMFAGV